MTVCRGSAILQPLCRVVSPRSRKILPRLYICGDPRIHTPTFNVVRGYQNGDYSYCYYSGPLGRLAPAGDYWRDADALEGLCSSGCRLDALAGVSNHRSPPAILNNPSVPITSIAAAQLSTAEGSKPNAGRLQLFACANNADTLELAGFYSTTKSSEEQDAPWLPWTDFPLPPDIPEPNQTLVANNVAVIPLADGRLQLWVSVIHVAPHGNANVYLSSCVQTAATWNAQFGPWETFDLSSNVPGQPVALSFIYPIAARLPPQVWVSPTNPMVTSVQSGAVNAANPLSGWSPWNKSPIPFTPLTPTAHPIPVQAAEDGQGRVYLWVNWGSSQVANAGTNWAFSYSSPNNAASWSPLTPFPTPELSLTDQNGLPHNVISAAQLPTGLLQVFYLGVSGTVHTCWQQSSQNPNSWTSWQNF